MDYVKNLRQLVGHRPLILTGGRAIIENEKGKILLHKRTDFKDLWSLPGGQTEIGESIEQTIIREIKEETGLDVIDFIPFGLASNPDYETITYPNNDVVQLMALAIYITKWKGTLTIDNTEVEELRFFSYNNLPNMAANEKRTLDYFQKYKEFHQFQLH